MIIKIRADNIMSTVYDSTENKQPSRIPDNELIRFVMHVDVFLSLWANELHPSKD